MKRTLSILVLALLCGAGYAQSIRLNDAVKNERERPMKNRPVPQERTDSKLVRQAGKITYRVVASPDASAPEGWVNVTIIEDSVWGENLLGYQMLLDADATAYGTVIPTLEQGIVLTDNCDGIPESLYDEFEYKIPENADPSCASTNIVLGDTVTIQIPEGVYDYMLVTPEADWGIWIAGGNNGRRDNILFEYGKHYTFIPSYNWDIYSDVIDIVVEHDLPNAPAAVSNLTATRSTASDLEVEISWTNPVLTAGGDNLAELTAVKVFLNSEEEPVYTSSSPVIGGEDSFTFTAPVQGVYSFRVVAVNIAGNGVDTSTETLRLCHRSMLSYFENFEESASISECIGNMSITGTEQWGTFNDDSRYVRGTRSACFSYSGTEQKSALILPRIEIPAAAQTIAPVLQFWSRLRYHEIVAGTSSVYISETDTDFESFTEIHQITESEWNGGWTRITIPLNNYTGKTVHLAFVYEGTNAHDWYIDDIRVVDLVDIIDVEVLKITHPITSPNFTENKEVKVLVTNNGAMPLSNFELKLECGDVTVTEPYTGNPVGALETVEFTFAQKLDLSAQGEYKIKVSLVPVEGDIDLVNDSKTTAVTNHGCPCITTFPWKEEFMTANCWLAYDADEDGFGWMHAAPAPPEEGGTGYGAMLSESFVVLLHGGFPVTPDNWLISSQITLNGSKPYSLQFQIAAQEMQLFREHYSVLVSTTGTELEDFTEIYSETIDQGPSGGHLNFKTVTLDLSAYSGQSIYIAFRHWDCTDQYLLILANISITENSAISNVETTPLEAGVSSGTLHIKGLAAGEQFTVYNASGQIVHQGVGSSNSTASAKLKARGIYVVRSAKDVVKVVY